jgi:hypothetical protein
MPKSVKVESASITQANDYGPDGRVPIQWKVVVGPYSFPPLDHHQLVDLWLALESWRKANAF